MESNRDYDDVKAMDIPGVIMGPFNPKYLFHLPRHPKASSMKFSREYPMRQGAGFFVDARGHEYRIRVGRGHEALVRVDKPNSARDRHRLNVAMRKLTKRQRAELAALA